METEPVLSQSAIVAAVSAVLIAAVSLGWLKLDDGQMKNIVGAVGALLVIIMPIIGGLWARNHTTPTAKPIDEDGMPLVRADDGQPGAAAVRAGRTVERGATPATGARSAAGPAPHWSH